MSRLAEEIVEEWLNQKGYFTIRGIRLGVDEIDLLAIKPRPDGSIDCRHIEVQVSFRPISYISPVPKQVRKATGRSPNSAKRSRDELKDGVEEWIQKKFLKPKKLQLLKSIAPGPWARELVVHSVKLEEELEMIRCHGIKVLHLSQIIKEAGTVGPIKSACGGDFIELVKQ